MAKIVWRRVLWTWFPEQGSTRSRWNLRKRGAIRRGCSVMRGGAFIGWAPDVRTAKRAVAKLDRDPRAPIATKEIEAAGLICRPSWERRTAKEEGR